MGRSAPFEGRLVRAVVVTLLLCVGLGTPTSSRAAPEGQLTWGVHISLAPTWFDPAETPGSSRRSWCSTRCTTRW